MLEHLSGDDVVEHLVGEREPRGIAVRAAAPRRGRQRGGVGVADCTEHRVHVFELGRVVVEGDDLGAAPQRLERVPARATAQVEHEVALGQAEPVVANGEHQRGLD